MVYVVLATNPVTSNWCTPEVLAVRMLADCVIAEIEVTLSSDENPAQYTLPALDTFKSKETDCFDALTSVTVSRGYKICVV
jgi:hypothetical protein